MLLLLPFFAQVAPKQLAKLFGFEQSKLTTNQDIATLADWPPCYLAFALQGCHPSLTSMNLNKLGGHICASLGQQKHKPPKDKTKAEVATDIHVHNKKWRARLLVIAEIGQVLDLTEGTVRQARSYPDVAGWRGKCGARSSLRGLDGY
jgi:hypothetical protein